MGSATAISQSETDMNNDLSTQNPEYLNAINSEDLENSKEISTKNVVSVVLPSNENAAISTSESDDNNTADINITQSASNYNPKYLKYVTLSVKMNNNGPSNAKNMTTSYLLNSNYLKWISDDGQGSYNHKTGLWSVQLLENDTYITLHVVTQIIRSNIIIKNSAIYLSGSTEDPNPLNNIALTSLNIPPSADVSITQSASNYYPRNFHNIYVIITVKNKGPNDAKNLIINSGLNPNQLKYISYYGNGYYNPKTGIWTISKLKSGSINALYIKVKVMAYKTKFKNTASYQPNTYDYNLNNNRAGISLTVPSFTTISSLAYALRIDTKSKYDNALNIFNWVRDYVEYSFYYGTRYGASGTLKLLKGNCVDLSRLIVTLARYSGISARYKYGTCYFYKGHEWISHVWTNLYANGRWYAADASNNINEFGVIKSWNTSNFVLNGVYRTLPF